MCYPIRETDVRSEGKSNTKIIRSLSVKAAIMYLSHPKIWDFQIFNYSHNPLSKDEKSRNRIIRIGVGA